MKYADGSKLGVVMKRKEDSHIPFFRGRKELDFANQANEVVWYGEQSDFLRRCDGEFGCLG